MAVTFAIRGTSKTAYFTGGTAAPVEIGTNSVDSGAGTGIIGNSIINLDQASFAQHTLLYGGRLTLPTTQKFSVLCRCALGDTTNTLQLFSIGQGGNNNVLQVRVGSGTSIQYSLTNSAGANLINSSSATTYTTATYYDFVVTVDTSLTTSAMKVYQDGALIATVNSTGARSAVPSWEGSFIMLAAENSGATSTSRIKLNEFVIWDTIIDPTSGGLNLNGSSRSSFVSVANFEGGAYTDPGVATVKTGTAYTFAGAAQSGTYDGSDRWTDVGIANVRSGSTYKANSTSNNRTGTASIPIAANVRSGTATDATTGTLDLPTAATVKTGTTFDGATKTGTYDGSDRWTDPGIANVRSATAYKANSVTNNRTGTAAVPVSADVRSGTSVDATTGSLDLPVIANVKTGISFDSASKTGTYDGSDRWTDPGVTNVRTSTAYKANSTSNNRTGSAVIPSASDVRSGTATDASTGTLAVPSASNVRSGVSIDAGAGTLIVPSLANTKIGVAGDGGNGTYTGSDRWTDPGSTLVAAGITYLANAVSETGTLTAVTNIISNTDLTALNLEAVLEAE